MTGSLRVTSSTREAVVFLDDERLGLAPQRAPTVRPGVHRLRVAGPGFLDQERNVTVDAGKETVVDVVLDRDPNAQIVELRAPALRVTSDVPEASVFVDRQFVGTAPVEVAQLTAGSHRVNVSAEGYEMFIDTLYFEDGAAPRELNVRFLEVRLDARVAVKHKRAFGSKVGTLVATERGLDYRTTDTQDSFFVGFGDLELFEIDYLKNNLRVRIRDGRTYNFASPSGGPNDLYAFHTKVEKARERLAR
jgi:hypothetical protein